MEAVVLAIVQKSVELAVSYLERAEFSGDDLSIQVCGLLKQLMLVILVDPSHLNCIFGYTNTFKPVT